jgi:mRNA interferase HigB
MRIIAIKTLKNYIEDYPESEGALLSWFDEIEKVDWETPNELKLMYRNASIINGKRVIFNIHGNSFRLIVDIEFRFEIVFIVWFGTHSEYDKIDAKTVKYVKTD